jgi:hypothetical protein
VRSQLHGRRSQGIRRLQGMTTLDSRTTRDTLPHGNRELPIDRSAGNLDLKLKLDTLPAYPAVAMRTALGERGPIVLVDMRRPAAMSFAPVGRSRLASWTTWVRSRRALREGRGLTFSRTFTGSQRGLQSSNLRLESLNSLILRRVLCFQTAVFRPQRGSLPLQAANSRGQPRPFGLPASIPAKCVRVFGHMATLPDKRGHNCSSLN